MDTISSAEFRKRYASLKGPTVVTVNGHPIGTWMPNVVAEFDTTPILRAERYDQRPLRAVPKHR